MRKRLALLLGALLLTGCASPGGSAVDPDDPWAGDGADDPEQDAWVLHHEDRGVTYAALKCGAPDGEWVVTRAGTPEGNGGVLEGTITFTLDPVGLIGFFDEATTLTFDGDVLTGTWEGEVSFERVDDTHAILDLDYRSGTVTYDGVTESATGVEDAPPMELVRSPAAECVR